MPTNPDHGDFVVERLPESAYFHVRRHGITNLLRRQFDTYDAAVAFALDSADAREAHTFIQSTDGWVCLD